MGCRADPAGYGDGYLTATSSTSNTSVALGGIGPPPAGAIGQLGRNRQLALAADAHALDAEVPALDDLARPSRKSMGGPRVVRSCRTWCRRGSGPCSAPRPSLPGGRGRRRRPDLQLLDRQPRRASSLRRPCVRSRAAARDDATHEHGDDGEQRGRRRDIARDDNTRCHKARGRERLGALGLCPRASHRVTPSTGPPRRRGPPVPFPRFQLNHGRSVAQPGSRSCAPASRRRDLDRGRRS